MKTIYTIAASLMLMATTASAVTDPTTIVGTPTSTLWVGTEDKTVLPDMCQFDSNTNGAMKLDADGQTWKTDAIGGSPAVVRVSFRGISRIRVEADDTTDIVGQVQVPFNGNGNGVIVETPATNWVTGAFDADVTYKGSEIRIVHDGVNSSTRAPRLTDVETFQWTDPAVAYPDSSFQEVSAGVATVIIHGKATPTGTAIYDANVNYQVRHKVTCLQ